MPRHIIKLIDDKTKTDYYLEWSTVVDAPITYGCSLEEFKEYYQQEYGRIGMEGFEKIIQQVQEKGISAYPPFDNLDLLFKFNRAGENDKSLDKEGLLEQYCRNRPATTSHTSSPE